MERRMERDKSSGATPETPFGNEGRPGDLVPIDGFRAGGWMRFLKVGALASTAWASRTGVHPLSHRGFAQRHRNGKWPGDQGFGTDWGSMKSWSPSSPPSRPNPDCFMPPKGASAVGPVPVL